MTDPLIVDVYSRDGRKDWRAFMAAGLPWCGAIFKASQGGRYRYDEWLTRERSAFLDAAGDRYGVDAFDGFYDFPDISVPGGPQASYLSVLLKRLAASAAALSGAWSTSSTAVSRSRTRRARKWRTARAHGPSATAS